MSNTYTVYYDELDGLRGVAILLVMSYHLFHYFPFFNFGWVGVDLFFVLSGFLISNLLLASADSPNYFRNFYSRRSLRIFPLYYFILCLFYFGGVFLFSDQGSDSIFYYLSSKKVWFLTFTQNLLFVSEGAPEMPYLTHLWSIAIEAQFYLFWPLFMLLVKNKIKWICILILTILAWRCYLYLNNAPKEVYYFHTLTRVDSMLIGSLLSVFSYKNEIPNRFWFPFYFTVFSFILIAIILYGNIYLDSPLIATFGYTCIGLLFSSSIYILVKRKIRIFNLLFYNPFLRFTGRISYSLYIFHLPIYLVVITKINTLFGTNNHLHNEVILSFISLILTYIISIASFTWIEMPFLKRKSQFI